MIKNVHDCLRMDFIKERNGQMMFFTSLLGFMVI